MYFSLLCVEPKHQRINSTMLVQMIFSTWFGYLVCWLSPTWYNIDCFSINYHNLITIIFNWSIPDHGTSPNEKISSRKFHKLFLTHLISPPFIHCKSFLHFSLHSFTFLEIFIIYYLIFIILKCCFFPLIFNIKMATEKFTNFDFFKSTLIWQLSEKSKEINLIKLKRLKKLY